jgi:hypothetical protein
MYDVSILKPPSECRIVMERVQAQKLDEIYALVFKRYCELSGKENEDPDYPLIRDFHETLAAYEQLLTKKTDQLQKPHGQDRR